MRSTYDFAPLWRSTIGFDRLFDLVDAAQQQAGTEDNYPPCNVERVGEDRYQISLRSPVSLPTKSRSPQNKAS